LLLPSALRVQQPVIVDNRPGGGTLVGLKAVMASVPDGYTLLFSNTPTHVIAQFGADGIAYDRSMTLLPSLRSAPRWPPRGPISSAFLIAAGRRPSRTCWAAASIMNFGAGATLLPFIREDKIKALAVTSPRRSAELPDVPTMIECGLPSLTTVTHYGLFGPAGVPTDVVAKLNGKMNAELKSPEVRASLLSVGVEPTGGSPQDFAAVIAQQLQQWAPVAKAIRFRMD